MAPSIKDICTEWGGGWSNADIVREVEYIIYCRQVPNAEKTEAKSKNVVEVIYGWDLRKTELR